MASNPSIKGSSISSLVEDIAKLRDSGHIPQALLEERLTEGDRELLDQPVNVASWYDIQSYRRLAELLDQNRERLSQLITAETGKTISDSRVVLGLARFESGVLENHDSVNGCIRDRCLYIRPKHTGREDRLEPSEFAERSRHGRHRQRRVECTAWPS